MSNLILKWINEVGLSKEVTDLERDFQDGYLLGELLHKYNQQMNFNEFCSFFVEARSWSPQNIIKTIPKGTSSHHFFQVSEASLW